jgi:hypothetical protein
VAHATGFVPRSVWDNDVVPLLDGRLEARSPRHRAWGGTARHT